MKSKLSYVIFIGIIFFSMGCKKDLLEKLPLDSPSSASFFNNKTEVEMGIMGCYQRLVDRISLKGAMPWIVTLDCTTDINWNRDSLVKTLKPSAISIRAWFEDDTK